MGGAARKYGCVISCSPGSPGATRMRSRLGETRESRARVFMPATQRAQPGTSPRLLVKRVIVCYGRIVDFPAFLLTRPRARRTCLSRAVHTNEMQRAVPYFSRDRHKFADSNGRHIRSRFLAVICRAFLREKLHGKTNTWM